jgi:hypothetical protein
VRLLLRIESTSSEEISVAVEPGEAEWNLDVLDGLFDFYFIQPVILQQRKAANLRCYPGRFIYAYNDVPTFTFANAETSFSNSFLSLSDGP